MKASPMTIKGISLGSGVSTMWTNHVVSSVTGHAVPTPAPKGPWSAWPQMALRTNSDCICVPESGKRSPCWTHLTQTQGRWASWPYCGRRVEDRSGAVPAEGLERVAAGAWVASGGAAAEQGPPGRSEPGTEAGGGPLAGEGPQAAGPTPVAGVLAGPAEEAGGERGLFLDQCTAERCPRC